ncbi:MAG: prephenate dehydrogenase [Ignavibacteriales bacterium]|nr:prephenate dehydrogenase [Ignavibacteriales bacterium]
MNITIIGLGVIGGSLGLAIKQNNPRAIITGVGKQQRITAALQRGAIDYGALSISAAVHDADIVFICTPVYTIISMLFEIAKNIKTNTIVTDVGSTKSEITTAAKKIFRTKGIFVGGHPMAGSEGKGIDFADPLMFQNATYVLCVEQHQKKKISALTTLLYSIGARVLFLSANEHDTVAATISHLPQLVAVAMMNLAGKKNKNNPAFLQLAAGGFRDITRIASSPYEMWKDILSTNSNEIRSVLREFSAALNVFEKDLRYPKTRQRFARQFITAKTLRDAIPKNSKGFLHPLYEVYVSVDDKPGVLSRLTTELFKANINIKDIELLKIRDGRGGTFRLSFDSKNESGQAERVLKKAQIKVL